MTRSARYEDGILTIRVDAKRGEKIVENKTQYRVEDLRPDKRVANPAYALHKGILEQTEDGPEFLIDGTVHHVAMEMTGPTCSCGHYTFRGANSRDHCKHVASLRALGLLPKGK